MQTAIVRSLEEARAACAGAAGAATLESLPAASASCGIGWWQALVAEVRAEFPTLEIEAVLDCGDAPGQALAAVAAGVEAVRLQAPPEVFERVAEIARQRGARLLG